MSGFKTLLAFVYRQAFVTCHVSFNSFYIAMSRKTCYNRFIVQENRTVGNWCRSFIEDIVTFYKSSQNQFRDKDLFLHRMFSYITFYQTTRKMHFFVLLLLLKLFIHQQYQINIHNFSDFYVNMSLRTKGARSYTFILCLSK